MEGKLKLNEVNEKLIYLTLKAWHTGDPSSPRPQAAAGPGRGARPHGPRQAHQGEGSLHTRRLDQAAGGEGCPLTGRLDQARCWRQDIQDNPADSDPGPGLSARPDV